MWNSPLYVVFPMNITAVFKLLLEHYIILFIVNLGVLWYISITRNSLKTQVHDSDATLARRIEHDRGTAGGVYARSITTRNVATPENVAKRTLPENVDNFAGGYIFGEPHTRKCSLV